MSNSRFEELEVWKKAHQLTLDIYRLTEQFPSKEQYRVNSQLCRASSSICANIVEGNARGSYKDYLRFLYIARGSLEETRYFILLSKDLNYLTEIQYNNLNQQIIIISKMLNGMIKGLIEKYSKADIR
jgi:four helix bundle protein